MLHVTLNAAVLAAFLSNHPQVVMVTEEYRPNVTPPYSGDIVIGWFVDGDKQHDTCAWEGRHAARIKRGADPPLSDVTGITLTEPPGTGPGMDGPLIDNG